MLFSALGIIFGLLAEKFDHIAVLTTFFITPLVFVGGVFTSLSMMPPLVRAISQANPMFYMIDALRHSYIGRGDAPLAAVADRRGGHRGRSVRRRAAHDGDRVSSCGRDGASRERRAGRIPARARRVPT